MTEQSTISKLSLVILTLTFGCIDPVELEFQSQESYLVIDGFITTDFGPHVIKVSQTAPFNNDEINLPPPVTGATVYIEDDQGNREDLVPGEAGDYLTSTSFQGVVGRSYTLTVENGENVYVSTSQEIQEPIILDSLYFEILLIESKLYGGNTENILRVYSDFSLPTENSNVGFTWSMTCFPDFDNCPGRRRVIGYSKLNGSEKGLNFENEFIEEVPLDFIIEWKRNPPPLAYTEFDLSFDLEIHSFGEETLRYYRQVNSQRNSQGSVFDPLPFQIYGNISNQSNPEEVVMGFFSARNIQYQSFVFVVI